MDGAGWPHGRMFGDGVYFTDCMCKALTYCSGGRPDEFFLLLCSAQPRRPGGSGEGGRGGGGNGGRRKGGTPLETR